MNYADEDIPELVPDFADDIRAALGVLMQTDSTDYARVIDEMLRAGVANRALAVRLYQMLPIAWARLILQMTGVHLMGDFLVHDQRTGTTTKHYVRLDPLYLQIMGLLPDVITRVPSEQAQRVYLRSPEFNAVLQAKRSGSNLNDLMLGPPILY